MCCKFHKTVALGHCGALVSDYFDVDELSCACVTDGMGKQASSSLLGSDVRPRNQGDAPETVIAEGCAAANAPEYYAHTLHPHQSWHTATLCLLGASGTRGVNLCQGDTLKVA